MLRKRKKLRDTFQGADIMGLQETHGLIGELEGVLFEQAAQAWLFLNPGENRNAGGAVITVKHSFASRGDMYAHNFG